MNRRKFLQQAGFAVGCVAGGVSGFGCSEDVQGVKAPKSGAAKSPAVVVICDPADPVASGVQGQWAVGQLCDAMSERNIAVSVAKRIEDAAAGMICVLAAGKSNPAAAGLAKRAGVALPEVPESAALVPVVADGRHVL